VKQNDSEKRKPLMATTTLPVEQVGEDEEVILEEPTKVILFNDNEHTFDEVITQIIKALKCTSQHAEDLTWDVHNQGKAVVFSGELVKCMEVSSVLEEIKLMTQIEV
jgi:ATP-dependent Clp protease adapter protein ClpS